MFRSVEGEGEWEGIEIGEFITLIIWENLIPIREVISKGQYNLPFGLRPTVISILDPINGQR